MRYRENAPEQFVWTEPAIGSLYIATTLACRYHEATQSKRIDGESGA
jgi:hypothetical protein